MIEKMIVVSQRYLPLTIKEVNWDGTLIQLNGPAWAFTSLSAWRISSADRVIFGCWDDRSYEQIGAYTNLEIIQIACQSDSLKIDPVFTFSNGHKIEIFSTDTFEPWTFGLDGEGVFIPTPSDPELFME
ncbi:hypothetical protein [Undibacterium sp.]|uniref:hypothetical protein n=1 Tax=Undibacterium sp. TaxID=1914977 RepID=UPI002731194C|nr:hypothetical protein [Undibacterium sp.]MDP1978690.1 hypothetical protein [Undibacterium sp.]